MTNDSNDAEDSVSSEVIPDPDLVIDDEGDVRQALPPRPLSRLRTDARFFTVRSLQVFVFFALSGFLIAWRFVSQMTLRHILAANNLDFQEQMTGIPVPTLLNWNDAQIHWMEFAATLQGPSLAIAWSVVGGILIAGFAYALNPTFQLFSSRSIVNVEALERLLRVSLLFLLPGLLFCFVIAIASLLETGVGTTLCVGVLSMSLWAGLSLTGQAGDFHLPPSKPRRSALGTLLLESLVFTLIVMVAVRFIYPVRLSDTLELAQLNGTFNRREWANIAGHALQAAVVFSGGIGLLAFAVAFPIKLKREVWPKTTIAIVGLLCVAAGCFSVFSVRPYWYAKLRQGSPESLLKLAPVPYNSERPASGVAEGDGAAKLLNNYLAPSGTKAPVIPDRSFLLFFRRGIGVVRQPGTTQDGLPADPAQIPTAEALLRRWTNGHPLSWMALRHIYNIRLRNFEVGPAIESLMLDQELSPHLTQVSLPLRQMLFTCASSPENRALLDKYADSSRFFFPDRQSMRTLGAMYERMGLPDKSLAWYRKAEMPKSFIAKVQAEKPMFNRGVVHGRLTLNGKPLANQIVFVNPTRMNGLSAELASGVLGSSRGIISPGFVMPRFPAYNVLPWNLRYVTASTHTDANGYFTIGDLTEGEYSFGAMLPEGTELTPGENHLVRVDHAPSALNVNYTTPTQDLGEIKIILPQPSLPAKR